MTTTERPIFRARAGRRALGVVLPRGLVVAAIYAASLAAPFPAIAAAQTPAAVAAGYAGRADVADFIDEMVDEFGFKARALRRFFASVRYQPSIIDAMSRPVLAPPKWHQYAPRFLSPERLRAGVAFWRANAATLERAQREFGVPAEVVVAIIGVETFYGRNAGSFRVADSLTTLAFDYPRRAEFFRKELKQFLLLTREQGISPLAPRGSYAGAQGLPQFMPGSWRNYAVDYDHDGTIDLANDVDDAIGSVANYLARHGWRAGGAVMEPASIEVDRVADVDRSLDGGLSERRTMQAWQSEGVGGKGFPGNPGDGPQTAAAAPAAPGVASEAAAGSADLPQAQSVGVLMLEELTEPSYWIVFDNWYVLTRYNRSRLYASVVWQFAQELKLAFAEL